MNHTEMRITGVRFDSTILRSCRSGDNWCMTWADDDCLYTSCDDGWGWDYTAPAGWYANQPIKTTCYNNRVWRLRGDPYDFNPEYLPNFPFYPVRDEWYGFGILSSKGVIYHFLTCASNHSFSYPFRGAKLIYTPDHGEHWLLPSGEGIYERERGKSADDMFFWCEGDDYAFSNIEFLQCGKDNRLSKDGYVYLYAPNGRYKWNELNCARVPAGKILIRSDYEFFAGYSENGDAQWTKDIGRRGAIHRFPAGYGWYSWLPSVVYDKGLDLFIMAAGGTGRGGSGMHELPGSLGIYFSENPWGPWKEAFYTDRWLDGHPESRLYQPKLSPKWISEDGRTMYLIFSDASDNWGIRYRWNQQKIILE